MGRKSVVKRVIDQSVKQSSGPRAVRAAVEAFEPRRLMSSVVVNSTADNVNDDVVTGATVTLRQALKYANEQSNTTITFDQSVFGDGQQTITLNSAYGQLSSNYGSTTSITGPDAGVTISGDDASRVFYTDGQLTLKNLTITHGYLYGNGYKGDGAGAYADFDGQLTIDHCTITNNFANYSGSAIYATTDSNYGRGWLKVYDSTITHNSTAVGGGTVWATDDNGALVQNTLIANNNDGAANTVMVSSRNADFVMTGTTIVGNTSQYGAIYFAGTTADLTNNTIVSSGAGYGGVGIELQSKNSINLVNNLFSTTGKSIWQTDVTATGYLHGSNNLIPDGTDGLAGTIHADPLLGTLGNYGGPTATIPLLPGSPAIDAGIDAGSISGVTTDARGVSRGIGGAWDIGAFESHGFNIVATGGGSQSTWTGTQFQTPLSAVVSSDYGEPIAGGRITFAAPASGASIDGIGAPQTLDASGLVSLVGTANSVPGTYDVTASAAGVASPATFNALSNVGVTFGASNLVYNGDTQQIAYTLSDPSAPVTKSYSQNGTPFNGKSVDVGTYTLNLTLNGITRSADYTITPATPTLAISAQSSTSYTGTAYNGVAAQPYGARGVALDSENLSIAYYAATDTARANPLAGAPTEPGQYQLVVTYNGSGNYASVTSSPYAFQITPAQPTVTVSASPKTYDGQAYAGAQASVAGVNGTTLDASGVTYAYYADNGGTPGSLLGNAPTDAGSYYVVASYAGNAEYQSAQSGAVAFSIGQATPTVTATEGSAVYDGQAHAGSGSVTGVGGSIATPTLTYYTVANGTLTNASAAAPTEAGDYAVVATYAGSTDYTAAKSDPAYFSLAKATPAVTVADAGGSYTGNAYAASGSVQGVSGSLGSPTLTYYAAHDGTLGAALGTTAPTEAGSYAVVATYAGNSDYNAASSDPAYFAITAVAPTLSMNANGGTYNGSAFAASGTVNGVNGSIGTPTLSYYGSDGTQLAAAPTNAGDYTVVASYAGTTDYTAVSSKPVAFSIAKATLTGSAGSASVVYGQSVPQLGGTLSGVVAGDGITLNVSTSATAGSDVGSYAVTPTLSDPNGKLANYAVTLTGGSVTVNAASTSLKLTSSTNGSSTTSQSVTFSAAVSVVAPGGGTPGGTVQFFSNGTSLGTASIVNGVASLSTSTLPAGQDAITAVFTPAGTNYNASNAALTQTVTAPVVVGGLVLLDKTGQGALTVTGGAKVNVTGHTITVDSSNGQAIVVNGSGSVTADAVNVVGGTSVTGGGKVSNVHTGQKSVSDPLAGLAAPTTSGLTVRSRSTLTIGSSTTVTLQPGVYVGGLNIGGAAKVTLAPGVYYLQGGGLTVAGSASLTGSGVLIYNAPAKSSDTLNFSGAATVKLSPPTSGTYAGITLFQDRASSNTISVSGSGSLNVSGTIYAAGATVNISGGGEAIAFGESVIVNDLLVSGSGELLA